MEKKPVIKKIFTKKSKVVQSSLGQLLLYKKNIKFLIQIQCILQQVLGTCNRHIWKTVVRAR